MQQPNNTITADSYQQHPFFFLGFYSSFLVSKFLAVLISVLFPCDFQSVMALLASVPTLVNISATLVFSLALVSKNGTSSSLANFLPYQKETSRFSESHLFATRTLMTSLAACILICFTQFSISLQEPRSSTAQASTMPMAPRQQVCVMVLNLSCPAVSQICSLTLAPSRGRDLVLKSMPMVERCEVWKESSQNRRRRLVLPTPLLPMMSSLTSKSYPVYLFILQTSKQQPGLTISQGEEVAEDRGLLQYRIVQPSPEEYFLPKRTNCSRSQIVSTPAPVIPLSIFAPTPPQNALTPCSLFKYLMHQIELSNLCASPDDIIILLLTVSSGYAAKPEVTVMPQLTRKLRKRWWIIYWGRVGLRESLRPKYIPRYIIMKTQETTKPRYTPRRPSELIVFRPQSQIPQNCLFPPNFTICISLVNLVLIQSRGQTKNCVDAPAALPYATLYSSPFQKEGVFLSQVKSVLYKFLKEKLRACVGKYLRTFVKFPLQQALKPYQWQIRLKESTIPLQGSERVFFQMRACCSCSRIFTTSMGEAKDLEMAAEDPESRNYIRNCQTAVKGYFGLASMRYYYGRWVNLGRVMEKRNFDFLGFFQRFEGLLLKQVQIRDDKTSQTQNHKI